MARRRRYQPRSEGQRDFLQNLTHRYVAFEAGWGSGKSFCGSRKLLYLHWLNNRHGQNVPQLAVAPTYGNARDFVVPALLDGCEELGWPVRWNGQNKDITFKDGSYPPIMVRTADDPSLITGFQVGAAWCDEAARYKEDSHNPRYDAIAQIDGRVRHPKAAVTQIMFTYTNEGDQTKIYRMMRSGSPDCAKYTATTASNWELAEWAEVQRRNLTPEMAEQYLDGGAMSLTGNNVYVSFSRATHVAPCKLDKRRPIDLAVDFNISPGMHGLIGQHDDAGGFSVVAEIHRKGMSVEHMVREGVAPLSHQYPETPWRVYGDPAGSARSVSDGRTDYQVLRQAMVSVGVTPSLHIRKSDPGQINRVNAVNVALRNAEGVSRVRIDPSCTGLLDDLQRVKWDDTGKIDKRDGSITHFSDALAYWIEAVEPIRRANTLPTHAPMASIRA